jgi:beta-glucanase (GH16 family)
MRTIRTIFAIIAVFSALGVCSLANAQQTTAVFDDEFTAGTSANPVSVNPNNWVFQTGNGINGWGNNEIEYYTNLLQNTYDDGQLLNIVDLNQPNFDGTGFNWTSGKLLSVPSWTYGQFQIRAKLTTGDGVWPAIWLLFTNGIYGNGGWPDNGEIDIMEEVGYNPNEVYFTLHNIQSGGTGTGSGAVSVPAATTGFHTYALDWAPDHISGLYDGNAVYTFPRNGQDWHSWPFDQPFHMILDDAIGGNWGGAEGVNPAITGQDFQIDYVRVQKKVSSPYLSTTPTIPANIEAANYDLGGEGFAYHSDSSTNQGGSYRTDGIGIAASGNPQHPYYVGWMNQDEWLNYTIDVLTSGSYPLTFQLASIFSGESFNVQVDDATVGTVSVPNTGGWTTWQAVNFGNVTLSAGTHVIRLLSNSPNWNVNFFTVGTIPQSPPAPTNLGAIGGDSQVGLSWNASAGAASYNVYRSRSAGTETLYQSGVTTTLFADTGVTNGTTYYYKVTAVNAGGESAESNEASATPQAPAIPNPPANLTAKAGNQQVALSWAISLGAAAYNVYRGTSTGAETLYQSGLSGTTFTDTNATDGTTYYYEVTAVNSSGESGKSNEANATPFATVSYPAGLQMLSSPYAYPGVSLDTLFGYSGVTLAVWSASGSQYILTPEAPANQIAIGQGYWARPPQAVTTTVAGTPAPTTGPFTISLEKGWNMIGAPFLSAIPIASLTFDNGSQTFAQATTGANPLIGATIYGYSSASNSYYAASSLAPEQGYWILAFSATNMEVPAP